MTKKGFTLLELMVVLVLLATVFALVTANFRFARSKLSGTAYQLTKDIQSIYAEAVRKGQIYRLLFNEEMTEYTIDVFEPPKPKPPEDDRKALEKWKEDQKKIEEAASALKESVLKTRIARGLFATVKTRSISSVTFKTFITPQLNNKDTPKGPFYLMFYPSGEMDEALIVFEDGNENAMSLLVHGLSGRVKTVAGEVTEEEWKKSTRSK